MTTSVVNGKIYAIGGGSGDFLNLLQVYDPLTDKWSTPQTQGDFTPHYGHTAEVFDGKIYIFGGVEKDG